jgi:EPS-associated MarR family transcriptional regulator
MNVSIDKDDIHLRMLRLVEEDPNITQRGMTRRLGISLGMVNFCLSELTRQGLIRMERFRKAPSKAPYMYHLTPAGIEAIGRLAFRFLKRKVAEYEAVKQQVQATHDLLRDLDADMDANMDDQELRQQLNQIIG